jgi:Putative zinc-finger
LVEKVCNEIDLNVTITMNMDHRNAVASNASERYLLGEMSEAERFAFEAHYFECVECAADVRAGDILARSVRAVYSDGSAPRPKVPEAVAPLRSWRSAWLTTPSLVPLAASVVLCAVVGYQSLVVIPGLDSSRAQAPVVLRAAARGDDQTVQLRAGEPYLMLSLDVNDAEPGSSLVYEILPQNGAVRDKGSAIAPPAGSPLIVTIPHSHLDRSGNWSVILRTPQGIEVARYPFHLKAN